jgi:protein-S-isoprenylcysteine O-methyltransferase Ste14
MMISFGRTAEPSAKSSDHHERRIGSRATTPSTETLAVPSDGQLLDEGSPNSGLGGLITTSISRTPPTQRLVRVCANLVGAGSAAVFSYSFLHYYIQTHRLIGIVFFAQQTLVALAYLIRRPARLVTRRLDDWLLAFAGTFIGVLFRPEGEHPAWGIWTGLALQLAGAAVAVTCILTLGRSFGFAAADRGVVTRGAYSVVRHPMYASYLLLDSGYLLQSLSLRNAAVLVFGTLCNAGRALAEERLLANNSDYLTYRRRVRRRIIPGVW